MDEVDKNYGVTFLAVADALVPQDNSPWWRRMRHLLYADAFTDAALMMVERMMPGHSVTVSTADAGSGASAEIHRWGRLYTGCEGYTHLGLADHRTSAQLAILSVLLAALSAQEHTDAA